ncbi:MAG: hypothetical protein Q8O76_07510 [Chloroflexota bacterium]|nr:hypothetical protein [Chloroflexota bacterium]
MIHPKLASSLPQAGLVLIAGDIRVGKSTLAYGLMEAMHERAPGRPAHVFGFPAAKAHLLPDWITPVDDPEFPDDSIVIADEAYRRFYSRESMSDSNKLADQFAGLVGQKGIMAIYVTQTARKLEIALVSGAQVFLLKKPSRLMVLLDRSALRPLLSRAFDSFAASRCPPAEATYIVSDPFEGFLEYSNTPPSFWSEDLSRVWKGVALAGTGGAATISRDDVYRELNRLAVECWDDNKVLREVLLKAVGDIDVGSWESAVATLDAGLSLAGPWRAKLERL